MSSKNVSNEEKVFNGGSLVDWAIIADAIELEADRQYCKYQLVFSDADIVDGAIVEETFNGQRICVKGFEHQFVGEQLNQLIASIRIGAVEKRQRIQAKNYGNGAANMLQKEKDINAVTDKENDDVARLEQSRLKQVLDAQASGSRHDAELRQFEADRAKAITILRKFLGPNPRNNITRELSEMRPRAAWKKLHDIYANDAATASHLNNTTKLMSNMSFDKEYGGANEHMGLLDKLNETLTAAGRGKSDAELVDYLIGAMERSKDGAIYKTALDVLTFSNRTSREEVLEAFRTVELKVKSAEALKGNQTIAGAKFGKADVVIAAAAAAP